MVQFSRVVLLNWVALIAHATICGLYIWKFATDNIAIPIYITYPSPYNSTLNYTSYFGTPPKSDRIGEFYPFIASFLFELVCVIAHCYILFYLAYNNCSTCCRSFSNPPNSKYLTYIKRNFNRYRWIEYSISATIMLLIIAVIYGYCSVILLLIFAFCNVTMIYLGDCLQVALREYVLCTMDAQFNIKNRLKNETFKDLNLAMEIETQVDIFETKLVTLTSFAKGNCIKYIISSWVIGMVPWLCMLVTLPYMVSAPAIAHVMFSGVFFHFFSFGLLEMYHVKTVFKTNSFADKDQLWFEAGYILLSLTSKTFLGITCLFLPKNNT